MKYYLQDLLDIRALRENEANQKLLREKKRVEQARMLVEEYKKALKEYAEWRVREEESMYQGVLRKKILLRRLMDLRMDVTLLRENELLKEQKIFEAESDLQKARAELDAAINQQKFAVRNKQKLEEHRGMWMEEWMKEQNLLLDREMEDLLTQRQRLDEEEELEEMEEYAEAADGAD